MKKYKEGARAFHGKVNTLTKQVKNLNGATRRAEELTEANTILTAEVTSIYETWDKARADAIEDYKDS